MSARPYKKNQKIQEESFGGDSEDRGSFDEKYNKLGTMNSETDLEKVFKQKKGGKKDTTQGFFTKVKHSEQGDDDDEYDDEIEVENRRSMVSEGQRSNRDYNIDMNLKEHE